MTTIQKNKNKVNAELNELCEWCGQPSTTVAELIEDEVEATLCKECLYVTNKMLHAEGRQVIHSVNSI